MKNKIGILKNDKYIFSIVNSVILLFATSHKLACALHYWPKEEKNTAYL